jgi:dual specificity tyrosine-phosphorylation-regulated kinase 2/3/4
MYYWGENIKIDQIKRECDEDCTLDSNINFDFDDLRGDYIIEKRDHIAYRYEILDILGQGSFGQVIKVFDHKAKEYSAIKIIRNRRRFLIQGKTEVAVLSNINLWDSEGDHNCVKMLDSFYFRRHLCIVFELLSANLYELLKSIEFRGLSEILISRMGRQIVSCLVLMHSHELIHCDLKPENVLLVDDSGSRIKVIDFGSSCSIKDKLFTYIQSRFYRSPEVILGCDYDTAIDMWSLGCIVVELFTGFPLFSGENEKEQFWCIIEVLGLPDESFLRRCSKKFVFFGIEKSYLYFICIDLYITNQI